MQYSFNNSRKIPKLAQFIPGIYNNFYYKILWYFLDVTVTMIINRAVLNCKEDKIIYKFGSVDS